MKSGPGGASAGEWPQDSPARGGGFGGSCWWINRIPEVMKRCIPSDWGSGPIKITYNAGQPLQSGFATFSWWAIGVTSICRFR